MSGGQSAKEFQFDLTGAVLCFDFANTVDNRCAPERRVDNLKDYAALLAWARQSAVISERQAAALVQAANDQPRAADRAFRKAVELREAIYRLFATIAGAQDPKPPDLSLLGAFAQEAFAHMRLECSATGFTWRLADDQRDLMLPLWPVAKSAADSLVSGELGKVRECAADNCGWLFMDRSKNQSRRWCNMKVCGNREKARQHHLRVKEQRLK